MDVTGWHESEKMMQGAKKPGFITWRSNQQ